MENEKLCPITGKDCKEVGCAWFNLKFDECLVKTIADSLDNLAFMADDKGIKVDVL